MADGVKFSQFDTVVSAESGDFMAGYRPGAPNTNIITSNEQLLDFVQENIEIQPGQVVDLSLQTVYETGNSGTIDLVTGVPFEINSTDTASRPMPAMSTAQFAAVDPLENGQMAWNTDTDRINVNTGDPSSHAIEQVAYLSDIVALEEDTIIGEMYFQGNASPTTISVAATPVKVNATYSSGTLLGFTQSTGTLTYNEAVTRAVTVSATLTATFDGSSNSATFFIARNGSVIAKSAQTVFFGGVTPAPLANPIQCAIEDLTFDDELELWVQNDDNADDIIVVGANFIVNSVGGFSYGGVTVVGEDYLTLSGQQITANPVDLNSTNVDGQLPFANVQDIATAKLLGRYDSGTGVIQQITLGTNLSLTGNTLNAAGDATVTLQDAYNNGNLVIQDGTHPYPATESDIDGNSTIETKSYSVLSPTVPALIDLTQLKAFDASNLGFTYFTERSAYWDSTGSNSKYSRIFAMYEGGASNIQNDYFSLDSRYKQVELFRRLTIQPEKTATTVVSGDASSIFDIITTEYGSRPAPSMTETQRDAITSPAQGLIIFNTDTTVFDFFDGSDWVPLSAKTGPYTPSFSGLANIGTFSSIRSSYIVSKLKSGEYATVTCSFTAVPTAISAVMYLSIPTFFNNFTSTGKASFVGGTSFATLTPSVTNTFRNADSVASSKNISVELNINASALNVSNTFYVTVTFEIP